MPTVKSIDIQAAKVEVKKCPLIVQQYVSGLINLIECNRQLTAKAIRKIKEQSARIKALEHEIEIWEESV